MPGCTFSDQGRRVSGVDLHPAAALDGAETHVGDIHFPRMDRAFAFVGMENDLQVACLVPEQGAVPDADQFAGILQQRIAVVFGPGAQRRVGRGAADAVEGTFVAVGRIGHVVSAVPPDHEAAFVDAGPDLFPLLRNMDAGAHRLFFQRRAVVFQLDDPDIQPVVEPVEIHVRPAVVVDEQRVVDARFIGDHRLPRLLYERTQRRVGGGDADVLFGREIHVEFVIQPVDLGRPEPFFAPDIRAVQGQSVAGVAFGPLPRGEVAGCPHLDAASGACAIGVIHPVVKQDERIGQGHFSEVLRRTAGDGEQRRD